MHYDAEIGNMYKITKHELNPLETVITKVFVKFPLSLCLKQRQHIFRQTDFYE